MKTPAMIAAIIVTGASGMLAGISFADSAPTANKWRIELDGQAQKTGDNQFRVTPRQGQPIEVTATVRSGRAENNVAKDVREARLLRELIREQGREGALGIVQGEHALAQIEFLEESGARENAPEIQPGVEPPHAEG